MAARRSSLAPCPATLIQEGTQDVTYCPSCVVARRRKSSCCTSRGREALVILFRDGGRLQARRRDAERDAGRRHPGTAHVGDEARSRHSHDYDLEKTIDFLAAPSALRLRDAVTLRFRRRACLVMKGPRFESGCRLFPRICGYVVSSSNVAAVVVACPLRLRRRVSDHVRLSCSQPFVEASEPKRV